MEVDCDGDVDLMGRDSGGDGAVVWDEATVVLNVRPIFLSSIGFLLLLFWALMISVLGMNLWIVH